MVDTGSMVSLITRSAVYGLGLRDMDIKDYKEKVFSYSSHRIKTEGKVTLEVNFTPGNSILHDFVIVPDKYMSTGILLGFDIISRKTFTWEPVTQNFVWNEHTYNTCNNSLYTIGKVTVKAVASSGPDIEKCDADQLVHVSHKLKLKPGEIYWLKCKEKTHQHMK